MSFEAVGTAPQEQNPEQEIDDLRAQLLELYEAQASGERPADEVAREVAEIAQVVTDKDLAEQILSPEIPEDERGKIQQALQLAINHKIFAQKRPHIYELKKDE